MLGKTGALAIEKSIIREMFMMLNQGIPDDLYLEVEDFASYVNRGRKIFLSLTN
jgi:hypothetical protein